MGKHKETLITIEKDRNNFALKVVENKDKDI